MLKLEKNSSTRDVAVIMRNRDFYCFNKTFLKAFLVAVAFHLLFITLFHVAPFQFHLNETIFPPVRVEASLPGNAITLAEIGESNIISSGLPPAPTSLPEFPSTPYFSIAPPKEYLAKEPNSTYDSFKRVEEGVYTPSFTTLAEKKKAGIEIIVSGPLLEKQLLLERKETPFSFKGESLADIRATYSILVDGISGKIVWYVPLEQTNNAKFNLFSVSLLQELQFTINRETVATAGEIEIHFYVAHHD